MKHRYDRMTSRETLIWPYERRESQLTWAFTNINLLTSFKRHIWVLTRIQVVNPWVVTFRATDLGTDVDSSCEPQPVIAFSFWALSNTHDESWSNTRVIARSLIHSSSCLTVNNCYRLRLIVRKPWNIDMARRETRKSINVSFHKYKPVDELLGRVGSGYESANWRFSSDIFGYWHGFRLWIRRLSLFERQIRVLTWTHLVNLLSRFERQEILLNVRSWALWR